MFLYLNTYLIKYIYVLEKIKTFQGSFKSSSIDNLGHTHSHKRFTSYRQLSCGKIVSFYYLHNNQKLCSRKSHENRILLNTSSQNPSLRHLTTINILLFAFIHRFVQTILTRGIPFSYCIILLCIKSCYKLSCNLKQRYPQIELYPKINTFRGIKSQQFIIIKYVMQIYIGNHPTQKQLIAKYITTLSYSFIRHTYDAIKLQQTKWFC